MVSLKHISRYKDIAWFLIKYGRADIVKQIGIDVPAESQAVTTQATADELAKDLQTLGPTFVKFGQLLSSQLDFLSEPYQQALANLQDRADTFPFEEVEKILSEELGVKLNKAFISIDPKPLAAASLSQVHEAILHSGRHVVVKVQRPGIREKVIDDLDVLEELASLLDNNKTLGTYFLEDKVRSLRTALINELDFKKEALNLKIMAHNLSEFELIMVPLPVDDYTTSRVLTMEYIASRNITKLHPLIKIDLDGDRLATELFKAYLKQIFIDGFVHIDPHPGNIYISDNNLLVLLDLGMVERISPQFQQDLLKLLLSISEGKGEEIADLVIKMGHRKEDFEQFKFKEEIADAVSQNQDLNWNQMAMGQLLLRIGRISGENGLRLPPKFNTLGKTLMNLDGIVKVLAPHFNPNAFIKENVGDLLQQRMQKVLSEASMSKLFLEAYDLLYKLPTKINEVFELFARNELQLKVQAFDEKEMMRGFEKIANRIALGLVLAAMILGAVLLMRVETPFHLFGYPALAMIMFFGAVLGGLIFIINILLFDTKSKDK